MKIKVSDASGMVLDWLVAKCEGWEIEDHIIVHVTSKFFNPSTVWAQGGSIIEREKMYVRFEQGEYWVVGLNNGDHEVGVGDTLLEAAMRCYVVNKLGEEVEVPDEIIGA